MHLPRQQPLPLPQVGACWPRCTSTACQLCSLKAPLSCMPQLKFCPTCRRYIQLCTGRSSGQCTGTKCHILHPFPGHIIDAHVFELQSVWLLMLPCRRNSRRLPGCCPFAVPRPVLLLGLSFGFSTGLWKQRSCNCCGPGICLPAEGAPSLQRCMSLSVHLCCWVEACKPSADSCSDSCRPEPLPQLAQAGSCWQLLRCWGHWHEQSQAQSASLNIAPKPLCNAFSLPAYVCETLHFIPMC